MLGEIERLERALEVVESTSEQHAAETVATRESRQEVQRELSAAEASLAEVRREAEHLRADYQRLSKNLRSEREAWQAERRELEKAHSGLEIQAVQMTTALQDAHSATEKAEKDAGRHAGVVDSLRTEMDALRASVVAAEAKAESLAEQNTVLREDQQKATTTLTEWVERATKAEAVLAASRNAPGAEEAGKSKSAPRRKRAAPKKATTT